MTIFDVLQDMKKILGEPGFNALAKSMNSFRARGDKDVLDAYADVPADTPADEVDVIAMALLISHSDRLTRSQAAWDWLKLGLNRIGIPLRWMKAEPAAIRKIAHESWLAGIRGKL